ncbi:hypothetical protein HCH52_05550 [Oscillospiraceae bacterium HV4-5-C5C]|nr:hypothetical protein [Oscillospiraceae bacterium HV4-5-C5C]
MISHHPDPAARTGLVLSSPLLTLEAEPRGAQLAQVRRKTDGLPLLWPGGRAPWTERSPLLFPFTGRLAGGTYRWQGQTYAMLQHGLAKDLLFDVLPSPPDELRFQLTDSLATRRSYPFSFKLQVSYQLAEASLLTRIEVSNPQALGDLIFAVGAHPGFMLPAGSQLEQWQLVLPQASAGQTERMQISAEGLWSGRGPAQVLQPRPGTDGLLLPLKESLFDVDGIFLSEPGQRVLLERKPGSAEDPSGVRPGPWLTLDFEGFRYLGIWQPARSHAPFLCLEPWSAMCGRSQIQEELSRMPDRCCLEPGQKAVFSWRASWQADWLKLS